MFLEEESSVVVVVSVYLQRYLVGLLLLPFVRVYVWFLCEFVVFVSSFFLV
jgi:hypothetical protein